MDWEYIESRGANTMVDDETIFTECYFEYALAGDLVVNGNTYYYRLIAHAADVDSKPGPVFAAKAYAPYQPEDDVGGL